jgi:hypothetical protein
MPRSTKKTIEAILTPTATTLTTKEDFDVQRFLWQQKVLPQPSFVN